MSRQIYLIIGASADVAAAFMKKLNETVKDKTTVIAHYAHQKSSLENMQKQLKNLEIVCLKADLSKEHETIQLIEQIQIRFGTPTHIVHMAAMPFQYMKVKQWNIDEVKKDMEVQLYSFAAVCKAFLPQMAKNRYGKVVVMLSSYTLGTPPKFMSNYITVKYALLGFVKATAIEYADKGIQINAISPTMMETKFLKNVDQRSIDFASQSSAMKRNIKVEETADAILWLLSDKATYINGINLNLSGGDQM